MKSGRIAISIEPAGPAGRTNQLKSYGKEDERVANRNPKGNRGPGDRKRTRAAGNLKRWKAGSRPSRVAAISAAGERRRCQAISGTSCSLKAEVSAGPCSSRATRRTSIREEAATLQGVWKTAPEPQSVATQQYIWRVRKTTVSRAWMGQSRRRSYRLVGMWRSCSIHGRNTPECT
jgi:hypothetical protein